MPLSPTYHDDVKNVLLSALRKKAEDVVLDVCPVCKVSLWESVFNSKCNIVTSAPSNDYLR